MSFRQTKIIRRKLIDCESSTRFPSQMIELVRVLNNMFKLNVRRGQCFQCLGTGHASQTGYEHNCFTRFLILKRIKSYYN